VPVVVDIHNDTDTPEQLHGHGLAIPVDADGASEQGTPFIPPHGRRRVAYTPKPAGFRFYHLHVTCLARGDAGMKNVWPCGLVVAAFASRGLAAWRLPPEASKVPMNGPVGLQAEGWNRRSRRMGRPKLNNCITIWEISRSKSSNLEPQAFSLRKASSPRAILCARGSTIGSSAMTLTSTSIP